VYQSDLIMFMGALDRGIMLSPLMVVSSYVEACMCMCCVFIYVRRYFLNMNTHTHIIYSICKGGGAHSLATHPVV
jgi:hypothetical protein